MSQARRARLFARDGGICQICLHKIQAGEPYDQDHIIPWALTYSDADENLRTVHTTCHRGEASKTSEDVARIAKAKRQGGEKGQAARRAKNGPQIKSRPFPKGQKQKWPSRPFGKGDRNA